MGIIQKVYLYSSRNGVGEETVAD